VTVTLTRGVLGPIGPRDSLGFVWARNGLGLLM
jgi:hypothetical protein